MSNLDTGAGFVNIDGQLVERDALGIVQRIKEYDEDLDVMCLDPGRADINDAPFVIIHKRTDGTAYRVFEAWKLDESVLERIYHSDGHRFNVHERITSIQAMQNKLKEDRYRDTAGKAIEIVEAAVRNQKSKFTYRDEKTDEKVTIYDSGGRPSERGDGKTYL